MREGCFNKGPLICITAVRSNISASVVVVVIRESTWRYDVSDFLGAVGKAKGKKARLLCCPGNIREFGGPQKNLHTFLSFSKGRGEKSRFISENKPYGGVIWHVHILLTSCSASSSLFPSKLSRIKRKRLLSLFPLSALDSPLFSPLLSWRLRRTKRNKRRRKDTDEIYRKVRDFPLFTCGEAVRSYRAV